MNIEQQISTKKKSSFFQKIIFSLAFISILSFIGIIIYIQSQLIKKGSLFKSFVFLFSEIVCYFFVIISVIYYIIFVFQTIGKYKYFKKITIFH